MCKYVHAHRHTSYGIVMNAVHTAREKSGQGQMSKVNHLGYVIQRDVFGKEKNATLYSLPGYKRGILSCHCR